MTSSCPGTPILSGGRRPCALQAMWLSPSDRLRQKASAMKRQDVRLSPTWAALSRFPGHRIIRTKSQQEPLPAAKRLIPLPPRAPGGSPASLDLRCLLSAWSPRVSAPNPAPLPSPSPGHTVQRMPFSAQVCAHAGRGQRRGAQTCPLCCRPQPPGVRVRSALAGGVNGGARRLPCVSDPSVGPHAPGAAGPRRCCVFSPP